LIEETGRLRNLVGERDIEIKHLKEEIRALKTNEFRQHKAIKDMDKDIEGLPQQMSTIAQENAILKVLGIFRLCDHFSRKKFTGSINSQLRTEKQ
jgi:hypothetical protein